MQTDNILILKPEFVIKTYNQSDTKVFMKDRYASGIIIVLLGKMEFFFGDQSILLQQNEAIFIPDGTSYSIAFYEHSESIVINFYTASQEHNAMKLRKIDAKTAEGFYEELNALLLKAKENHYMILATYHRLLSLFFDSKTPVHTAESYVRKAEENILEKFSSPTFACKDVAKELNISEVYLRKLFAKYRHIPISKFLLNVRMNHARHLILEGYSISKTAACSGYCDIYQFSRAYKKYFGFPPSKTNQEKA